MTTYYSISEALNMPYAEDGPIGESVWVNTNGEYTTTNSNGKERPIGTVLDVGKDGKATILLRSLDMEYETPYPKTPYDSNQPRVYNYEYSNKSPTVPQDPIKPPITQKKTRKVLIETGKRKFNFED